MIIIFNNRAFSLVKGLPTPSAAAKQYFLVAIGGENQGSGPTTAPFLINLVASVRGSEGVPGLRRSLC